MKRLPLMVVLVFATALALACGGPQEQAQELEINFTSEPDPPRMGENVFGIEVMRGSAPVTDAEVSLELYMAAMPEMNMPEMRTTVPLQHEGGGSYRGKGNVVMAGAWDATVKVTRGGDQIGAREFSITAQ